MQLDCFLASKRERSTRRRPVYQFRSINSGGLPFKIPEARNKNITWNSDVLSLHIARVSPGFDIFFSFSLSLFFLSRFLFFFGLPASRRQLSSRLASTTSSPLVQHRRQFTLPSRRAGGESFLPIRRVWALRKVDISRLDSFSTFCIEYIDADAVRRRIFRTPPVFNLPSVDGDRNISGMCPTTRLWKSKSEYHFFSFLLV